LLRLLLDSSLRRRRPGLGSVFSSRDRIDGISHRRVHALGQIGSIVIARLSAEVYMSRLARFRFRLSTDISYRCRGREGRKPVSLGIRGTYVSHIKIPMSYVCVYLLASYPLFFTKMIAAISSNVTSGRDSR